MSLFNFSPEELMTFFAVLVRYSTLFSVLPFIGDRAIPAPIKILLAFTVTLALFPALVSSQQISVQTATKWSATSSGIAFTIVLETLFGLILGYTARLVFEGISLGANLVGNFMGFASASSYDPHQESQTQIIAQLQTAIAMLVFLALDGHHLMLRASLDSYRVIGMGKMGFTAAFSQRLIHLSGEVFYFGIQVAAPVAISLFSVNVVFGILSKAMPQLNIFMLSFAITALVGFFVMLINLTDFQGSASAILNRIGDFMESIMRTLVER